jgi:hypothetical protein
MPTSYIVSAEAGGRWAVRQEESEGPASIYDDRGTALTAAVELARSNPPSRVRVLGLDGSVEDERVYTGRLT